MTFQVFPVGGWKKRTVAIPRPRGKLALLRLRSRGPWTTYHATPWTDTARELSAGPGLFLTSGRSWHPFVLAGRYTHLEVSKAGENGVARWQLDRLRLEDVPLLPADSADKGTRLFAWEGGQVEIRYECPNSTGALQFTHHAFGNGEPLEVEATGTLRGTVRLSGPGYLWVHPRAGGSWSLRTV